MCAMDGIAKVATVCDHLTPHKGNLAAFYSGPFQSLCARHHNSTKQREEKLGYALGCDADGKPLDPGHLWNRSQQPSRAL